MRRGPPGFTLLELLVVVGLVAAATAVLLGGLGGGGRSVALQAGQATVANLVAAARARAMATGNPTRVLVHHDPASPLAGERYLRRLALEENRQGAWRTLQGASLPAGVFVVPHQSRSPANLFGPAPGWTKTDGSRLHSTCLSAGFVLRAVDHDVAEAWVPVTFTANGTTATSGALVVATGRPLPPGGYAAGESPVRLENVEAVRGLQISAYGLAVPIHERAGF